MKLVPHADSLVESVRAIDVTLDWAEPARLRLRYNVSGEIAQLLIPRPGSPGRQDGLWEDTQTLDSHEGETPLMQKTRLREAVHRAIWRLDYDCCTGETRAGLGSISPTRYLPVA